MLVTHQLGPANEQRMTRDLAQHPAVLGAVNVGRRGGLAEIAGRNDWPDHRSINVALVKDNAVASNAPSTICPRPDLPRTIRAASVPNAQCSAVPKSTQFTAAR